jgi:hypothetical protein
MAKSGTKIVEIRTIMMPIYLVFFTANVCRYFSSWRRRRKFRRIWTWHPEMETALPNTDLNKINLVNTIHTNAAGFKVQHQASSLSTTTT